MNIVEKIDYYLSKCMDINESKPVGGEDDGALKFVFKLPTEGSFTANFLDGSSVTIDVDKNDKSSGNYALLTKDTGKVMEVWTKKPTREQAHQRLKELKFFG